MIEPARTEVRWQQARITRIIERTPHLKSFFFHLPEPFQPLAGQHVDLRLTAPDGYQAMRSYSIASAPGSGAEIELAIDKLDDGEVSPFFHEVAEVGDDIELRGPLGGHFVWRPDDGGPLLLIGGGSGVVPLLAMIRQAFGQRSPIPIALLFSARTPGEAPFLDELRDIEAKWPTFHLRLALTRASAPRPGDFARRIDAEMIGTILADLVEVPRHIFICGSNGFVNTAADLAVAAGVAADIIRTERYG